MWCNQIFSLMSPMDDVKGGYVIANTVVCDSYETANQLARLSYGELAIAQETTYFPVSIGCTYVNGKYYDESGEEIQKNLTEKEQITQLNRLVSTQDGQINSLNQVNAELLFQISLLQMGITDTELQ